MDDKKEKAAAADLSFETLCEFLDENKWTYEKDRKNRKVTCLVKGETLDIQFLVNIFEDEQLVSIASPMPFDVPDERRKQLAVAVSRANHGLIDGNFDYDYINGTIFFRMTTCFAGGIVGQDLFAYLIYITCRMMDDYYTTFNELCLHDASVEDIIKKVK